MDFLELAKERYSCRKMSDRAVEPEKLERIIAAGLAAPTAKNFQPFRIWIFESEEALKIIHEVTPCIFNAKTFILVGAKADEAWVRSADNANFTHVDAAIAATHMLLEIQDLGLATTWVGVFDAPKLQQLCPDTASCDLIALFPLGYAAEDAEPSPRHFERRTAEELVKRL